VEFEPIGRQFSCRQRPSETRKCRQLNISALGTKVPDRRDRNFYVYKSSTERLREKLSQYCCEEERVLTLSRPELLEAIAEVVLVTKRAGDAGKDGPPADRESTLSSPESTAGNLDLHPLSARASIAGAILERCGLAV